MNVQALLFLILNGALYGSLSIASRFSLGQFNPVGYSSFRFILASLAYLSFYIFRVKGRKFPTDKVLLKRSILFGIFGDALQVTLIVFSMMYISSGLAATLITFFPVIVVLLAHFFLPDEPLNLLKIVGVLVAMAGTLLMTLTGQTGIAGNTSSGLPGYLFMLGAGLVSGLSSIYARKKMTGFDTFDTTSIRMLSGAVSVTLFALIFGGLDVSRVNMTGVMVLVYASFVLFTGFFLSFLIIKRFGVTPLAMSSYVQPVVAGVGGVLLLHETFTGIMLVGVVLIVAGVIIINRGINKQKP